MDTTAYIGDRGQSPLLGEHWFRKIFVGSKAIWAIMLILMSVSAWVVFSSTSTKAFQAMNQGGSFFGVFVKHIMFMFIGLILCVVVSHTPVKHFRNFSVHLLLVSVVLLAMVPFFGVEINDAKRYLNLFGISFQPSEVVRLALINYVAAMLRKKDGQHASVETFMWIMIPSFLICAWIAMENVSTGGILFIVIFAMSLIGGANKEWMTRLALAGGVAVVLLVAVLLAVPSNPDGKLTGVGRLSTVKGRIERFVEQSTQPITTKTFSDPTGIDAQVVSAQKAIANSGVVGVGFGNSKLRNFLPEAYSDFVYCIIIEEGGLLAAVIVLLAYIVLFFTIGGIARRTRSVYKSLLVMGIGMIITLQALLHMMICTNLFPITGQNLPFISRGGSSYVVTAVYFGILLAVSNENKMRANQELAKVSGNTVVEPEVIPEMPDDQESYE